MTFNNRNDHFDNKALLLKDKIMQNFQFLIAEYITICEDKKYDILSIFSQVLYYLIFHNYFYSSLNL